MRSCAWPFPFRVGAMGIVGRPHGLSWTWRFARECTNRRPGAAGARIGTGRRDGRSGVVRQPFRPDEAAGVAADRGGRGQRDDDVFLSALPDARFAGRDPASLPPGVGYLRKDRLTDPKALVDALGAVLARSRAATPRHDLDPTRPMARLSRTQVEVLRMVALGMSNQQIADERGTTARAAHDVLTRAMAIIGTTDTGEGSARVAAAREYIRAVGLPTTP